MNNRFDLTLEQNIFLAKKVLVASIYSAAKIEGANTTYPETETILDGVNVPTARLSDITLILNLRDAWRYLLNNIESSEIDLEFISKINENVSRNESLSWGTLRTGKIGIRGTKLKPPVPNKATVEENLTRIVASTETTTKKALDVMLYIMNSQLFWDGNKRTAQLIANAFLIKSGAGILLIDEDNIGEFNKLLTDFYETQCDNTLKHFLYEKCIFGIE
jgi:Fic family protein